MRPGDRQAGANYSKDNVNLSLDYQDLERHDLLSGEARYIEDEIRNSTLSMAFGGLAAVFLLVAMILNWILYFRERTRTFLWHAIIIIFLILLAGLCAAWGAGAAKNLKLGKNVSGVLTGVVFFVGLGAAVYLLVESIWWIFYRRVHFNYLASLKTNQDLWDHRMVRGSSFVDGWKGSRRMMWWVVFFNILAALCFIFCAYAARSIVWNRYQLSRFGIYLGLAVAAFSSWMVIYWVEEGYEYQRNIPLDISRELLLVLKFAAIALLVCCGLNAIINALHNKPGYFIISVLEVIILLIMISAAGMLLREVRYANEKELFDGKCTTTMSTIHENDIDRWCVAGGKYLPAGASCNKQYMTTRWETNNEARALNPGCCGIAKYFYLYPIMLVGFWSLIAIACIGIVIALNIYVADANDYLTQASSQFGLADFAGLPLVFLTILVWGIYFWARPHNKLQYTPMSSQVNFLDPVNNKIQGFDIVPAILIDSSNNQTTAPVATDGCYQYDLTRQPAFSFGTGSSSACTDANACYQRVAILVNDGRIKFTPAAVSSNEANQGMITNRGLFFPDCTNKDSDYTFFYGSPSAVSDMFQRMRVCPNTKTAVPKISIFGDQQKKEDVQPNGMLKTESTTATTLTAADGASCGTGFTSWNSGVKCEGSCKLTFTAAPNGAFYLLKGRLFYTGVDGKTSYAIHSKVKVAARTGKDSTALGNEYVLYENGLFTISGIPRYNSTSYLLTLDISDPTGVYQPQSVDVYVRRDRGGSLDLPAGDIRLTTKDGKICGPNDTSCINGQSLQTGNLVIEALDASSVNFTAQSPVSGAAVELRKGVSVAGQKIKDVTTDANGKLTITGIPYGSYLLVAKKQGYLDYYVPVFIQKSSSTERSVMLKDEDAANDMRVVTTIKEPEADFDLNVVARSDTGTTCTLSPVNKYCAYGAYLNDVNKGEGEETILFKKLAVADYLAYVTPAGTYSNSCQNSEEFESNVGSYHAAWNWESFKATRNINSLNIIARTLGRNNLKEVDSEGVVISAISAARNVESPSAAAVVKQVLAVNGTEVTAGSVYLSTASRKVANNYYYGQDTTSTVKPASYTPPAVGAGNHIWVSCFTGYGASSVVNVQEVTEQIPTIDQCKERIREQRPSLTVERLRQAYKDRPQA